MVKSTSYMTVPGRIALSVFVVFLPSAVSPKIGVISLPAYVVGTETCCKPVRTLIALPCSSNECKSACISQCSHTDDACLVVWVVFNTTYQSSGAPPAERYNTVCTALAGVLERLVGDVRWGVHGSIAVQPGRLNAAAFQDRLERFHLLGLLWRRQEQRFRLVQSLHLIWQLLNAAAAEDDAAGVGVVFEGLHYGGWSKSNRPLVARLEYCRLLKRVCSAMLTRGGQLV